MSKGKLRVHAEIDSADASSEVVATLWTDAENVSYTRLTGEYFMMTDCFGSTDTAGVIRIYDTTDAAGKLIYVAHVEANAGFVVPINTEIAIESLAVIHDTGAPNVFVGARGWIARK